MADYDLGRARGKITIDLEDKATDVAEKQLVKLEAISTRLDKAMSGVNRAAINAYQGFKSLNGGLVPMVKNLQTAQDLGSKYVTMATRMSRSSNALTGEVRKLSNAYDLMKVAGAAFNIPLLRGPDTSKLPKLVQQIMALYGVIRLFRGLQPIITRLISSLDILGVAAKKAVAILGFLGNITGITAGFGAITNAAGKLGGVLRGLGFSWGTLIAIFGNAISKIPVLGSMLTKTGNSAKTMASGIRGALIPAMMKFKSVSTAVGGQLQQTFGMTEKMSRAVTRLAIFGLNAGIAWKGFQSAMKLVAKAVFGGAAAISGSLGAIKILGAVVLGAADAMKQLSKVALLAPAAISIAGSAFAALKIGLLGVGDALKTVTGDQEAFDEAIKKMAPSAQDTMRSIRGFKEELLGIKETVQGNLFADLAPGLEDVGRKILPIVEEGLGGVATAFNGAAKSAISFLSEAQTGADLKGIFRDTSATVLNLGETVKPLMSVFRDLAAVGSRMFAEMTQGAGNAARKFAEFISQARADGSIRQWIEQGIQGFKDLWATIQNVANIVRSFFGHFGIGGDGALAKLRDMTDSMLAIFDASGLAGGSIEDLIERLETISGKYLEALGYALAEIQPVIEDILPWLEKVALMMDDSLRKAVNILIIPLKILAALLAGPMGDNLANFAAHALTAVIVLKALKLVSGAFTPIVAGASAASTALTSTNRALLTAFRGFSALRPQALVAGREMGRFGTAIQNIGTHVPVIRKMQESFVKAKYSLGESTTMAQKFQAVMFKIAPTMGAIGAAIDKVTASLMRMQAMATAAVGGIQRFAGSLGTSAGRMVAFNRIMSQMALLPIRALDGISALQRGLGHTADAAKRAGRSLANNLKGGLAAAATGVKTLASSMVGLVGGPLIAGLLALAAAGYALYASFKAPGKQAKALEEQLTSVSTATRGLVGAFETANGAIGDEVFGAVSDNLTNMREQLNEVAKTGTGFWADLGSATRDFGTDLGNIATLGFGNFTAGARRTNDDLDEIANRAKAAEGAFKKLGLSSEEMAATFNDGGAYEKLRSDLLGIADGGDAAAAVLAEQKTIFDQTAASMSRIGAPAITMSEALKVIGDEAASSSDKLNAMKTALQAMGILETSAQEAMFGVTEAIKDVGEAAVQAFPPEAGNFLNAMGTGFDTTSTNAIALHDALKKMGDSLIGVASSGGDVQGAYAQMSAVLDQFGVSTGLGRQKIDELARSVGIAPRELSLFVALNGATEAEQQLFQISEFVERVGGVKEITMKASTVDAQEALRALGAKVEVINADTGEIKITASAEQATVIMNQIETLKKNLQNPANVSVGVTGAPQAAADIGAVGTAAEGVDGTTATIDATIEGATQAEEAIKNLGETARAEIPPVNVDVSQAGAQETAGALDNVKGAAENAQGGIDSFKGTVESAMSAAKAAVDGFTSHASSALNTAASNANASGAALGQGFADGIMSKVGEVQAAAGALAAAASAPLPNSPAKIGPFSGRGWTPFRGAALAKGFADGINSGIPGVDDQAMAMSKAVQNAIDSIRTSIGFVNPEPVALADQIGDTKYIRNDKTEAELKAENQKRVEERIASDELSAAKEKQKTAKDEAEKAMWEAKYPEKVKEEKEQTGEQLAEQAAKDAETNDKKAYEDEKKAADDRMAKALQVLEEGNSDAAVTAGAVDELRKQGFPSDEATVKALNDLGGRDSTDADVVRGLGVLDSTIQNEGDLERKETLEALRDSVLSRRGVEEYDPFAGASENILDDSVGVANDVLGIIDTIKQGMASAKDLAKLAIRGFQNTNDITTAIDGVQSIANAFGSVASTVGNVVSTVASIAAALGSAIPGIGQISAGIGMFTGALSSANGIIDLAQDVFKLGGQIMGGFLSKIAGGADGALMGDVKMLLDTNTGELKRWSSDNPDDKRSTKVMNGTGNTTNTGVQNLNIYQGPGQDPYKMIDSAMFAVKASSQGAY